MFTREEFDPHAPVFYEGINPKPELRQKLRDLGARLHAERVANDPGMAEMRLEPQTPEQAEVADLEFTYHLVTDSIAKFGVEIVADAVAKSLDPAVLLFRLAEAVKNEL